MLLSADRVVLPTGSVEPGWVETSGDRITGAGPGTPPAPVDRHLAGTLVPGFVDTHSHGGGGASYTSGDPGQAATVLATHRAHGTTSMMASLVTDTIDRLEESVRSLAPLVHSGELVGLHLEGPWLSEAHCGAHDPALLRAPDPAEVSRVLDASADTVRMVTLAPELAGGLDTVALLADRGVIAAIGHSDATDAVTRRALDVGARRRDPPLQRDAPDPPPRTGPGAGAGRGPARPRRADRRRHPPAPRRCCAGRRPRRRTASCSSPTPWARPAPRDGDYELGPAPVQVRDGVARLASNGAIAGSTLTMDRAVRYAVQVVGLPLDTVVEAATSTPARVLGLTDVGAIAPGLRADLVHLDDTLHVVAVMRAGAWLEIG